MTKTATGLCNRARPLFGKKGWEDGIVGLERKRADGKSWKTDVDGQRDERGGRKDAHSILHQHYYRWKFSWIKENPSLTVKQPALHFPHCFSETRHEVRLLSSPRVWLIGCHCREACPSGNYREFLENFHDTQIKGAFPGTACEPPLSSG